MKILGSMKTVGSVYENKKGHILEITHISNKRIAFILEKEGRKKGMSLSFESFNNFIVENDFYII